MTQPIYAIGDIHGHLDKLDQAIELIEQDGGRDAKVVCVGDYIDRGPNSKGVIDRLIQLAQSRTLITLKGNHDRMMEWFLETPPRHDPHMMVGMHWLHERIGGIETLASYGISVTPMQDLLSDIHAQARRHIPQDHQAFLKNLKTSFETDDLYFCHAGIRPDVPLAEQTENDLVWIRQEFHAHTLPHPKYIVHGHTPINFPKNYGNRLNIDGGAAFGRELVPVVLDGTKKFALTKSGRIELGPDA